MDNSKDALVKNKEWMLNHFQNSIYLPGNRTPILNLIYVLLQNITYFCVSVYILPYDFQKPCQNGVNSKKWEKKYYWSITKYVFY